MFPTLSHSPSLLFLPLCENRMICISSENSFPKRRKYSRRKDVPRTGCETLGHSHSGGAAQCLRPTIGHNAVEGEKARKLLPDLKSLEFQTSELSFDR